MSHYDDNEPSCPICGSSMFWEECETCGGDGAIEEDDEDEDWGVTWDVCDICDGAGGWDVCLNAKNHPVEKVK